MKSQQASYFCHHDSKKKSMGREIPSKFEFTEREQIWYDYWMMHCYFRSVPDQRKPYTIVIPPPNVTGVLHMGHMLNNTLQDILIRKARMQGYNACWVPGTDHASIATEAKVVAKLKAEGIDKKDLSRVEFLKHAWDWTHQYGGVILEQLKRLGCSCDWERTKFTLDEDMSAAVIKTFVDLHEQGLIYKGYRMVNWDPEAQTTLSDEEVIYEEKPGQLYHIKYPVVDSEDVVVIATTRPETLLGDTAVCIHPEDERYTHLQGKEVMVPIVNRKVPIITDTYVEREFGTGCLKVTPAHDPNDKLLGEKHQLEFIDIFNPDGTLNAQGLHYEGQDRFEVRKTIAKELEESGLLVKKENYNHKVGTSERTKAVIEPRISEQWFLKMETLAQPALKAVLASEEIELLPAKFKNTYRHWMENIRDWNISRQLWWGHRIPAYYYGPGVDDYVVAQTPEQALEKAQQLTGNHALKLTDLQQDKDVLDTWFSSWLWPISVFDGVVRPDNEEINYYYPTQDLVTGPDILFFWVARMIMSGYALRETPPFKKVYLTGLVRDKQGRKMSKQLGNSPDALGLIDTYGADAVRVGLMLSTAAGNDLLFDESLCQQGKNFTNKIWNAYRLIQGWEIDAQSPQPEATRLALTWYSHAFSQALETANDHFSKYRISDALMTAYRLVWDDFCSWLLEIVKPPYGQAIDAQTYASLIGLFENNLKLLHPFMPFVTEELWQAIAKRSPEEALLISHWPEVQAIDQALLDNFSLVQQLVGQLRNFRKENQIGFKDPLTLTVTNSADALPFAPVIKTLGFLADIQYQSVGKDAQGGRFRSGQLEFFVPLEKAIDRSEERKKMEEELRYAQGFLASVQKKLSNEKFVAHAPENVIALERKKAADAEEKIALLKQGLEQL